MFRRLAGYPEMIGRQPSEITGVADQQAMPGYQVFFQCSRGKCGRHPDQEIVGIGIVYSPPGGGSHFLTPGGSIGQKLFEGWAKLLPVTENIQACLYSQPVDRPGHLTLP